MAQNYYELLGVNRTASDKEIKAAYRRMARKLHPDVNPNDERAQEQFKKVNEAYEVVGDPKRRKDYDQFGDNWKHADQMRNMGGGHGPGGGMSFNLSDLFGGAAGQSAGGFGDLFGGAMGGHSRQQRPQTMKHQGTIDVSLDEVYTGATRRISIGSSMPGSSKRNLEVQVPKGVPDGRKIRLRPDGNTEVTLTVKVRSDKRFSRDGANLRADIAVPLLDAILGGEAEVPTMTGRIALNIPPGTQNGRSFKIKGRGLPKVNSDEYGDLYATVKVRLPDTLSDEEERLYAQLRDIRNGASVGEASSEEDAG
jgi:DnaJ-class molecular chaperone